MIIIQLHPGFSGKHPDRDPPKTSPPSYIPVKEYRIVEDEKEPFLIATGSGKTAMSKG